jgi:hypothetical protein
VCAVLAQALWDYTRDHCTPQPSAYALLSYETHPARKVATYATEAEATAKCAARGGYPFSVCDLIDGLSPGDWLRRYFRREFGRSIAARWFN